MASPQLLPQVWAAADAARYECDTGPIAFRPTLMFQTRTTSFTLRNAGATCLPFSWTVVEATSGTADSSGLYQAWRASEQAAMRISSAWLSCLLARPPLWCSSSECLLYTII
jgi:hypothetical protein